MIFVTVGEQLPFDRLIRHVDAWAGRVGRDDVFAQTGTGSYEPRHLRSVPRLSPPEFRRAMDRAHAVVAHAGMGTILTALERGKPLLVVPRLARLREHRSDHQVGAARYFWKRGHVLAAFDDRDIAAQLDRLEQIEAPPVIGRRASEQLLERIRAFGGERRAI